MTEVPEGEGRIAGVTVPRAWIFVGILAALFTFPFAYAISLELGARAGFLYALAVSFLCTWVTIGRMRRR